ncbi:MAG: hypothetical protein QM770_00365 [Tepidisphaeraceae bacterium]
MLRRLLALSAATLATSAGVASAQHANFVLFGQPSSDSKLQPAENKFVMPVTDPYFSENSFITSDVRLGVMYQTYPGSLPFGTKRVVTRAKTHLHGQKTALTGAGIDHAMIYTGQVRLALTNEFQAVLYKAGYTDLGGQLTEADGWNDVGLGLKWNFLQDWGNNLHAAVGVGYESGIGDPSVFENDSEYRAWVSVDKGLGKLHLGGTFNVRFGEHDNTDSNLLSFHGHADYYLNKYVSPVVELNYYTPFSTTAGSAGTPAFADLGNLDSSNKTLTIGTGLEVRPMENLGLRAAYEIPLYSKNDIYGWRVTFSAVYSF